MTPKQSALTVVRMAQAHAQADLEANGRIRPGVFMLVRNNPQTDGRLSRPTAIGSILEEGFADQADQDAFLQDIQHEASRLDAVALALCVQAEAELDDTAQRLPVALLHIEDASGLTLLHAPIERAQARLCLGPFVALQGEAAANASAIGPLLPPTRARQP